MGHNRLQINLLGKPEVHLDDERLTNFSTTKTEALLYYLAATGQSHRRETLAGLLWPEMPEAKARRNLTKSLTVLRRLLEPFLLIETQRVGFNPEVAFGLDVTQFTEIVSTAPLSPDTITLYRGDFLESFSVKGSLAFEEWLLIQREQLRTLAINALETLMEQATRERDYVNGVTYGRRLLELDPWRESVHQQLMLLLARQGQPAAALAQYQQCRQTLADELDVAPMPETTALFKRIQMARLDRPYALPASSTPFVGRLEELEHISRLLTDSRCRLLTLVGLGGMGKTRLALAAAQQANREQAWHFLHGVLFVSVAAITTPDLLPTALADALGLPLSGSQEPLAQLAHFLRDQEMLLVLDNFEHLLAGVPTLSHLLQTCPHIKFLITSREALQIEAEYRFDVTGLPFPTVGKLMTQDGWLTEQVSSVTTYPAIQLFLQVAHQVRPQFELTAKTAPEVIRICQQLSGIPLALKLAASWLRLLTCGEIVTEIERGLDLLASTMRDLPPRQRSMTAVFDYSWHMLTAVEQTCLAGLSVFRDGFTTQAARVIVGAALPTLAGLVDRALLHSRQTAQGTRYYLHELTRQYAAEKLAQVPETTVSIREAHMHYYASQLEKLTLALSGNTPQSAYAAIHQEIGNTRHAWQQAITQLNLGSLNCLMKPLYLFFARQGWFAEGQERMAVAVTAIQTSERRDKTAVKTVGNLLARQGSFMRLQGQFTSAEMILRQSIQQAHQAAAPYLLAFALQELGALLRDQSRFTEAVEMFEESLNIAQELNDQPLIAEATAKMGIITWDQSDHLEAQARLTEALDLFRVQHNQHQIAKTLNSLGNVVMSMGDYRAALVYYEEALPIMRTLEDWLMLDTVLINLGMVSNNMNDFVQARHYYEESLEICQRIGDEVGVAYCLTGLGQANVTEGNLQEGRQLLEQSLNLNRDMGRDRYVAINLNLLGDLAQLEEKWQLARSLYEESLAVSEAIPHQWGVASSYLRLGDLNVVESDEVAASYHYLAALSLGQVMGTEGIVLTALTNLSARLLKRGEVETAVYVLQIVTKQPSISDSWQQTATGLLASAMPQLSLTQQQRIQTEVEAGTLTTAVDCIQTTFRSFGIL